MASRQQSFDCASVFAGLMVLLSLSGPAVTAADGTGWRLKQIGEVIGERILTVSPDGLKLEKVRGGVTVVTKAPDWKVNIYNRKGKTFWETTVKDFRGEATATLYNADRQRLSSGIWSKPKSIAALGHQANYRTMAPPHGSSGDQTRFGGIWTARLWSFSDIKVAPQAFTVLSKVYQLPQIIEMPLKLTFRDSDDGTIRVVNTLAIEKVPLTSNEFDVPSGFHRAKSQADAFVDPVSQGAFDGFTHWADPDLDRKQKPAH